MNKNIVMVGAMAVGLYLLSQANKPKKPIPKKKTAHTKLKPKKVVPKKKKAYNKLKIKKAVAKKKTAHKKYIPHVAVVKKKYYKKPSKK